MIEYLSQKLSIVLQHEELVKRQRQP
jgi:hypothetical protein